MTFKIPIDQASVKRNPPAVIMPGATSYHFTCTTLPAVMRGESGVHITAYALDKEHGHTDIEGTMHKQMAELLWHEHNQDATFFARHGLCIEMRTEVIDVQCGPQPKWSYNYTPTEVQCDSCDAKFMHTKLESREEWRGPALYWLERVCPECGEAYCCELEWEKLKEPK